MKTLILLFCLFPGLASAGSLYRCVGERGQISYQTASCGTGQRTDRTIEYTPDPISTRPHAALASAAKRRAPNLRSSGKRLHFASTRKPQQSPCARAKAKREAQLQKLGFERTFDDLSRIDAACPIP